MRRQGAATLALQRPAIGSGGTKLSVGRMSLIGPTRTSHNSAFAPPSGALRTSKGLFK